MDRKGSLPEINVAHLMANESHGEAADAFSSASAYLHDDLASPRLLKSKKNAFVLEVLRASMFRSKSLTDLSNSIFKGEGTVDNLNVKKAISTSSTVLLTETNNIGSSAANAINNSMSSPHYDCQSKSAAAKQWQAMASLAVNDLNSLNTSNCTSTLLFTPINNLTFTSHEQK
jgi:hypothetical protein